MEPSEDTREPDYRFTLANERTFLAWIRTALALLAGGVAVVQLVPALSIPGIRHGLGTVLTAAGGVLAVLAVRRWQNVQAAMRRGVELPKSWMPVLLGCVVISVQP
jgi:putative membrane protein